MYAYNYQEAEYAATYNHYFIENCWVLDPLVPTYFVYAALWGLITLIFTIYLYCMPEQERFSLQKSLLLLPSLKAFEVLLDGAFLNMCPWYGNPGTSSIQYVQMARISVVTICYTAFLAYFYLLCKGWQTVIVQLTRNQATNLTIIMGGVYLTYSAYFLSLDFSTIYTIMNVIMVLLYSGIGITYAKNCRDNIKRVQANLLIMRDNDENIMRD